MEKVILYPGQISLEGLKLLVMSQGECSLHPDALNKIIDSYQKVKEVILSEQVVYGINTGFGLLAQQQISTDKLQELQRNILLSHACGTGNLLEDQIVILILILKINSLAQGYSGVSPQLIDFFINLYNKRIYPCIPGKGSVGASGDLVPLAHLSLPLIGMGEVRVAGQVKPAASALAEAGLSPLELQAKEGLALLNGLQVSTALCLHAYFICQTLFTTALVAGAMTVDAALASDVPFDDRIQRVRGYATQRKVAAVLRQLLAGSEIRESHRDCDRVQDPYSVRCQPQIMGAILQQMHFVHSTLAIEINAVTDNPLVFSEDNVILSGGNFHGEIIAMAADNLALAIAEMGANSERRIALLVDHNFSNLPPFLVEDSGVNSGFMVAHVTAAACASENKALAHPHSVDSLPTSANQEDHVSMATNGARRLMSMLDNTATILAIELLAAAQGLEFRKPLKTAPLLQNAYDRVRQFVPAYETDRYFAPDLALIKEKIVQGEFCISGNMVESLFTPS